MKYFVFYFLCIILLASCTNKDGATKALKDAGYHPVNVGGYAIWGCGEDDFYHTKFKAYSPDSSRIVTGVVCQGILKGKTIRLD